MISILIPLLLVGGLLLALFTGFGFSIRFKPSRSKIFVALSTYIISMVTVVPFSFLLVMFIAGPHSGFLEPGIYSQIVFLIGLLVVIVIPVLAVIATLRRFGNGGHAI